MEGSAASVTEGRREVWESLSLSSSYPPVPCPSVCVCISTHSWEIAFLLHSLSSRIYHFPESPLSQPLYLVSKYKHWPLLFLPFSLHEGNVLLQAMGKHNSPGIFDSGHDAAHLFERGDGAERRVHLSASSDQIKHTRRRHRLHSIQFSSSSCFYLTEGYMYILTLPHSGFNRYIGQLTGSRAILFILLTRIYAEQGNNENQISPSVNMLSRRNSWLQRSRKKRD